MNGSSSRCFLVNTYTQVFRCVRQMGRGTTWLCRGQHQYDTALLRIGRLVALAASISPRVELGILLFPDSKVVVQDVISSILLC